VAGSLGGGWLERRRFVKELEHHLEDCVADLRRAGVPEDAACRDAIARLGDVDAIVGAVRATRSARSLSWRRLARVHLAWIAVGAMSIVTVGAAELPQASGAKVPAQVSGAKVPAQASGARVPVFRVGRATRVEAGQVTGRRHEHSRASYPARPSVR
jgi:hypothetical protein